MTKRLLQFLLLVIILSGCASVGEQFLFNAKKGFEIGKTTKWEILTEYGEPYQSKNVSNENGSFEICNYVYAHGGLDLMHNKLLIVEYSQDLVNGYLYFSNFEGEETDFNSDVVNKIEKGVTTKNDIQKMLNHPTGILNCPTMLEGQEDKCENVKEMWVWTYISKYYVSDKSKKRKRKSLIIRFDKSDVVMNYELETEN